MLLFVSSQRNKTAYFYLLLVLHFMVIYLKVYTPIEIRCALNKKVFSDLTRLTFFRVKLVFECEFKISCFLELWDLGTLGPLGLGTLGPWDSWTSSLFQYLLILPLTSSYLLLSHPPNLLLKYGVVMGGGG